MKRSAEHRKLTKLINNYKKAQAATDAVDKLWDVDPENAEIEAAWDKACKAEDAAFTALAEELHRFSHGMLTMKAARSVIRVKFDEVEALVARLA